MDIMRSQGNVMWIDMPHHHVRHLKLFFKVTDYNFFTNAMTKIHAMI